MASVALILSVVAIVVTAANLLLSIGNARRLRRVVDHRLPVEPGALSDGTKLPDPVQVAIGEALGESDRFVMIVATSSCPACQNLARTLNRSHSASGDLPFVIVDSSEPDSGSFADLLEFPVKVLRDHEKRMYSAMEVTAVPYSFLVANGRIVRHALGDAIDDFLRDAAPAAAGARNGH